jgi:hypothetical protein
MMPYRRYAANHRRCIHCQGTHASEDHHLSLTVPIVSNSGYPVLSPIQEQIETSTNDDTPHSYKKMRFSLPSQQFTFATHQKQQWPLPPRPIPPGTCTANQQEWEAIIEFLKEERACIWTLWALLDMAKNNDVELQGLYKDSPVTADADWGTFAWGPMLQWEEPSPADDLPPA